MLYRVSLLMSACVRALTVTTAVYLLLTCIRLLFSVLLFVRLPGQLAFEISLLIARFTPLYTDSLTSSCVSLQPSDLPYRQPDRQTGEWTNGRSA